MLGFQVNVYRVEDPGLLAPKRFMARLRIQGSIEEQAKQIRKTVIAGELLASWLCGCDGLHWLDHLCIDGRVRRGPNNSGYPLTFFGNAQAIGIAILSGFADPLDRQADLDIEALVLARRDEWFLIEARDQS